MRAEQVTGPVAHHGESPVWDARLGRLLWVDMLAGDVLSMAPRGNVARQHVAATATCVRPRVDGGYVLATERGFALLDASGEVDMLADAWDDPLVRMNDGACDPQGRFYCRSMAYEASHGRGALYRLDPDRTVHRVLGSVTISNGLGWSPDGRTVFYVDSPTQRVDAFTPSFGHRRAFVEIPWGAGMPDGLAVDAEGGIWVALWGGGAVHRYTAAGQLDVIVELAVRQPTSCAFGGERLDELFITTSAQDLANPEPAAGAVFAVRPGGNWAADLGLRRMTDTTAAELDAVLTAMAAVGRLAIPDRASLLRTIAAALDEAVDDLVALAVDETHLSTTRLTGELVRTTLQLRFFADVVAEGACFEAVIEHADADWPLGPRPDLRSVLEPIGPTLVFAASNFPFAFSVAGGDTAAAIAAGCPIVVKAHPGHPRLAAACGDILAAVRAPVAIVYGVDAGRAALVDPRIKAAAFTGSTAAGRALFDLATSRQDPIPFYGELGSVNPVFASRGAVGARGPQIVEGFVGSFTLGVGQFCTKPGLLFLPSGHGLSDALVRAVQVVAAAPMLGDWVEDRYLKILGERRGRGSVVPLHAGNGTLPTLLVASLDDIASDPELLGEECFGPASIVFEYSDDHELLAAARSFAGTLTATIHAEDDETAWVRPLLDVLGDRAGRVVFNGWPTGVTVSPAMHHGGPWPATTAPLHSSVGGNAIGRFLRPVCFQGAPDALLPPALQDANPLGIRRRIDGEFR